MNKDAISKLLTVPDNWHWGTLTNAKDKNIRIGWNCPSNPRGLIVIAEGRTEVIEEYFETIRDFNAEGYACAIMDWQGQGMSYRYFDDNSRHHSEGFDHDIDDFAAFIDHLNGTPDLKGLPKILFAHSMGGNIGLRYLANNPKEFACAFLSAPMLGLNPKRMIKYAGNFILGLATRFNRLNRYALGQARWSETFAHVAKYKVSSDPVRREVQPHLFKTRPELQCGGVTYGWLKEALSSIKQLQTPEVSKKIITPVFIGIAGKDIVVDNEGACKTAVLLPDSTIKVYKDAEHQIHREQDYIRDEIMHDFYDFVKSHLPHP